MVAKSELPTIRGDKWRLAYRAQLVSILGDDAPPVSSRGRRFYNIDLWHLRVFTSIVCRWIVANPDKTPTIDDLKAWVAETNASKRPFRQAVIARTPEWLSVREGFALIGGSIHEGGHTLYSRRTPLRVEDVVWILDVWNKVPEWNRFHGMIQRWSNVIEDIRIERLLRVEYPGTYVKLHDLQDFILRMEAEGEENARAHGANTRGALSIVMRTFRDVGLGYVTPTQEAALDKYRADNPEAVRLVLDGPLSPLLRETIALGEDDCECLRLAFEVVIALYTVSSKTYCPACGARGSKLTITPKLDADGNKVKGKRVVTCSVCGWTDEMDLPPEEDEEDDEPIDDIRFEDPKQENDEKEEGKKGSGGEGAEDDNQGGSKGSDESDDGDDSKGAGDSKGEGEGEDDGEDADSDPQDGAGDAEGDSPDGEGTDETEGDSDGQSGSPDEGDESDDGSAGAGSSEGDDKNDAASDDKADGSKSDDDGPEDPGDVGGGHSEGTDNPDNDWSDLADEALEGADDDLGMHDSASALEDTVNDKNDADEKADPVKDGEARYRPFDTGLDDVRIVPTSYRGKTGDDENARHLLGSVRKEAAFFRSRLRQIVRAAEMTGTVHGVRRGRDLSDRYLVDTKASLLSGKTPKRAFYAVDEKIETSISVVLELDESYSMKRRLKDATRMMVALAEPLDGLGAAVMAAGFRNGKHADLSGVNPNDLDGCHRVHGVTHDVFKTFDEPFRAARHRFANTQAEGSTPMSDGLQFALDNIEGRPEAHRVVFVLTDGAPDTGHAAVIKRQVRLAKRAGIHVIGVGVGSGARRVMDLFDDHVYSPSFHEAPRLLVKKLNEVVDARMLSRRGRRMAKTG
jgi:hypothetical protein